MEPVTCNNIKYSVKKIKSSIESSSSPSYYSFDLQNINYQLSLACLS